MGKSGKSKGYAAAGRGRGRSDDERELALLEEFMRSDTVASLAGAIAARLGQTRSEDLIEEAGLSAGRNDR